MTVILNPGIPEDICGLVTKAMILSWFEIEEVFYSELDRSLDMRYGTITFEVYADTGLGREGNIGIAKEIEASVLKKL